MLVGSDRGRVDEFDKWIDKFGNAHPIQEMENDYIENCVAFLQRRANSFREVLKERYCDELYCAIEDLESSIDRFVEELNRRSALDIFIEREITEEDKLVMGAHPFH